MANWIYLCASWALCRLCNMRNRLGILLFGLTVLLSIIGIFVLYQKLFYENPFAYFAAQKSQWYHTGTLPWIGLKNFLNSVVYDTTFGAMWRMDFVILTFVVVLLIFSWKKIPHHIFFFGCGVVLLTLSQTYILGMSRYMMMVLPVYFYGAVLLTRYPILKYPTYIIFGALMVFNTILFSLSKMIF